MLRAKKKKPEKRKFKSWQPLATLIKERGTEAGKVLWAAVSINTTGLPHFPWKCDTARHSSSSYCRPKPRTKGQREQEKLIVCQQPKWPIIFPYLKFLVSCGQAWEKKLAKNTLPEILPRYSLFIKYLTKNVYLQMLRKNNFKRNILYLQYKRYYAKYLKWIILLNYYINTMGRYYFTHFTLRVTLQWTEIK